MAVPTVEVLCDDNEGRSGVLGVHLGCGASGLVATGPVPLALVRSWRCGAGVVVATGPVPLALVRSWRCGAGGLGAYCIR